MTEEEEEGVYEDGWFLAMEMGEEEEEEEEEEEKGISVNENIWQHG